MKIAYLENQLSTTRIELEDIATERDSMKFIEIDSHRQDSIDSC